MLSTPADAQDTGQDTSTFEEETAPVCEMEPAPAPDAPGGWGASWTTEHALRLHPRANTDLRVDLRFIFGDGIEIQSSLGPWAADAAALTSPLELSAPAEVGERLVAVFALVTALDSRGVTVGHQAAPLRFVRRANGSVEWLDAASAEARVERTPVPAGLVDEGVVGMEVTP